MAESNVNLLLDTVRKNQVRIIYAVQNDYNARYITAKILNDGLPVAVSSTDAISINAERLDGEKKAFSGKVNADGTVKIPVTQWMAEFEGDVICSVSIVGTDKRLTTTNFCINVEHSVWDGTSEPSADNPNKDVILEIIASENVRIANENTRIANENARKTAENTRSTNETTRMTNEDARVVAEIGRESAEKVRRDEFATWSIELGKISAFDKRIENLESAITPGIVTPTVDDSVAYAKDVPTGALPYAQVSKIGGMSRKCENLFSGEISVKTAPTTYSFNNGTLKLLRNGGTIQGGIWSKEKYKSGTYTISFSLSGMESTNFVLATATTASATHAGTWIKTWYANGKASFIFTLTEDRYIGFFTDGDGIEITAANVMLNTGETALPYEPYFEGLRDAKVTAVESVGVNLISFPYTDTTKTVNGVAFTVRADGGIYIKGTAEYETHFWLSNDIDLGDTPINAITGTSATNGSYSVSKRIYYNNHNLTISILNGTVIDEILYPMVNKGSTALPYIPYFKYTLEIPEAVQALDGYGAGIPNVKYNYLSLEDKTYYKTVERVILKGTESVSYANYSASLDTQQFNITIANCGGNLALCDRLPTTWDAAGGLLGITSVQTQLVMGVPKSWLTPFGFVDGTASTYVSSFLAYLKNEYNNGTPLTVIYSLSASHVVETDLSAYFGEDHFIEVEAGGTVTAVNEFGYDVPSVIEYTVKGSDAA